MRSSGGDGAEAAVHGSGARPSSALAHIKLTHVPYPGISAISLALKSNELQVGFASVGTAISGVRTGFAVPIAVAGDKRHPNLPDVPTFAEAGYPKMQGPNWWGFVVPAKTPPEIVEKISADLQDVLHDPKLKNALLQNNNYSTVGDTPAEFAERIRQTSALWTPIVESLHIERQ